MVLKQFFIKNVDTMKLVAFSVSLSVKDISASKQFYDNAGKIETFDDVREIQRQLIEKGIKVKNEADETFQKTVEPVEWNNLLDAYIEQH